jgi:hypothetical protein
MRWFTPKNSRPYKQFYNAENVSKTARIKNTALSSLAVPEKVAAQVKNVAGGLCRRPPTLDFTEQVDRLADPRTGFDEKKEIIDELVLLRLLLSRDLVAESMSRTGLVRNMVPKSWSELSKFEKFVQFLELSSVCAAVGELASVAANSNLVANVVSQFQTAQTAVANTATAKEASEKTRQLREFAAKVGEVIVIKAASESAVLATGISVVPILKFFQRKFATQNRAEVLAYLDSLLSEFPGIPEILFDPDYSISLFSTSEKAKQVLANYLETLKERSTLAPKAVSLTNFVRTRRRRGGGRRRRGKKTRVRRAAK